tara:strand:- start:226 stop:483 length:258 start_codon:yes stop_codon:yes gene_type:complete
MHDHIEDDDTKHQVPGSGTAILLHVGSIVKHALIQDHYFLGNYKEAIALIIASYSVPIGVLLRLGLITDVARSFEDEIVDSREFA